MCDFLICFVHITMYTLVIQTHSNFAEETSFAGMSLQNKKVGIFSAQQYWQSRLESFFIIIDYKVSDRSGRCFHFCIRLDARTIDLFLHLFT